MLRAEEVVERLGLVPLEGEGGMYRSTYLCDRTLEGVSIGSAIYYFLHGEAFSHLHLLTGDEVYFYHGGGPVDLVELFPDGTWQVTRLGNRLEQGEVPQHLVPAGVWQGSRLAPGGEWTLMSTSMSPAYTPGCYTHGCREELLARWPQAREWIERLTGEARAF